MIIPSLFSLIAFMALIFKLPGVSEFFGLLPCQTCVETSPWTPMIGGAYFATLTTLLLLFPRLFTPAISKAGLMWSIAIMAILTFRSPEICVPCLISHLAHVTCWFWVLLFPAKSILKEDFSSLSYFALFISPLLAASFFLSLNLSLLVYGLPKEIFSQGMVQVGDSLLNIKTPYLEGTDFKKENGTVLFFVGPNCPYCKELYPSLKLLGEELNKSSVQFIALTRQITEEMKVSLSSFNWIEDPKGILIKELGVPGFPTLIVIDKNGVVKDVLAGDQKEAAQIIRNKLIDFD